MAKTIKPKKLKLAAGVLGVVMAGSPLAQDITVNFDIPAQPASSALIAFGEQADMTVLLDHSVRDIPVPGLQGTYKVEDAIKLLLKDLDLTYRISNDSIIVSPAVSEKSYAKKKSGRKRFAFFSAIAAAFASATAPVGAVAEEETTGGAIEEVLVTAQKRSQSLQDVPIAITAFTEDVLREQDISTLEDFSERTPGLSFTAINPGQPNFRIRGVGSGADGAGEDIPVAMYIDGVYIGRMTTITLDLFDMERVEILRGPQGTLFGRNATGGAFNITTIKPSLETGGYVQATIGNLNRINTQGYLTGALVDDVLAGKLAWSTRDRDGYMDNRFTGNDDLMNEHKKSIRGQLLYTPSDDTKMLFSLDYTQDRLGPRGRVPVTPGAERTNIFLANGGSPRDALDDIEGKTDREVFGGSLNIDMETDYGTLTSITSWRQSDFFDLEDFGGLNPVINPVPTGGAREWIDTVEETTKQFTQEVRLASNSGGDLEWVAGAFALWQNVHRIEEFDFYQTVAGVSGINPRTQTTAVSDQDNKTKNFAVFSQGTYQLTDNLSLTAGLRYTYEEKSIRQKGIRGDFIVSEDFDGSDSESWSNFSPKLGIEWSISDDILTYASISRGFKSGGYPGQPRGLTQATTPFNEEILDQFEIGFKSRWFDDRLQLNVSAFHQEYDDLQVLIEDVANNTFVTGNAAAAENRGVEVEWIVIPLEGLEISGYYAYLDSELTEFVNAFSGVDLSGTQRGGAPEHSYNIAAKYTVPLKSGAKWTFDVDYSYTDDNLRTVSFTPRKDQMIREYDLVNARIAYAGANETWEVAAWVKNLTDELWQLHTVNTFGVYSDLYAPPRTYGVAVSYRW